jgi:hypothetical protein
MKNMNIPINDFIHCVQQARSLQRHQESDKKLWMAFSHLAGNSTTGFLAYAIWRGRSNMLTLIQNATNRTPGVQQNTPGASLAQN